MTRRSSRSASSSPRRRVLPLSLAVVTALAAAAVASACGEPRGVGDPCVPEKEGDPDFHGFDEGEVNVESKSMQCRTRTCLVNHFRGRVTDAPGARPRCSHRPPDDAVYCSCRCANADDRTDDGFPYCACPDGFTCTQLVTSIGAPDEGLPGAYCIKAGTAYEPTDCP